MWSVEQKTCKNRSKMALKRPIFSHKWLILWLQKYLFINLSWHGGCGTLLSSFEDLEVPKTPKSSIFWPGLPKTPAPQRPRISESKVFPCLQCVSSDRKNQNIRHSWKSLWILTRALGQTNTGVNFRILPKIFYQNICLIVPCCNTCKDPNGLLHPEWPEIPYMNTSSLGIS